MGKIVILYLFIVEYIFAGVVVNIGESYQKALKYEAKVQSYYYQKMAKQEEINQAKSKLYPKITFETSATARDYKLNYNGDTRDERYFTLTLSAKMPVYHPEYFNDIEQSKLKYYYSSLHLKSLKQKLAFDVTEAFISIVRAKNSMEVAKVYMKANLARYEQIKKLYDKRLANKMDLLSSKVTYEQSKIKVNKEKQNLKLAKFKFKNLTGIRDIDVSSIDLENVDISSLVIPSSKKRLEYFNFDILKAKLNITLMKKQVESSNYEYYPKVDFSASTSKYDSKNTYTDYDDESRFVLSVKIPLYQGGYISSDIAKYKYLLSSAKEDLKDTKRKVFANYEELIVNANSSRKNIVLYKDAINSAKLYLHAVTKGYEKGLKNLIDIEDAKTKLFEAKFKLIDSVYEYIKSYIFLLDLFAELDEKKLSEIDRILFIK